MNSVVIEKYGISPDDIEKDLCPEKNSGPFSTFIEYSKQKKYMTGLINKYDQKKYEAKKKKLGEDLEIGKKVLILAERIRKKSSLASFINKLFKTFLTLIKKKHLL